MTQHTVLPPELDPRGPRRPVKPPKPSKPARGWRRPLGITAAIVSVCVLAASGLLYTRYLHYDHNLTKAAGIIKSEAQIVNNKRMSSMVGGLNSDFGSFTNNFELGWTTGKYTRPTLTIAYANTAPTTVSYAFDTPYNPTVTQTAGPSLDSPSRGACAASRRRHPYRFRARLHPRRDHRL